MSDSTLSSNALRDYLARTTHDHSLQTWTVAAAAFIYGVYIVFNYLDVPVLSALELVWNAVVHLIPARLVLALAKSKSSGEGGDTMLLSQSASERHAFKSEALRGIFGLNNGSFKTPLELRKPSGDNSSGNTSSKVESEVPPGLGNWDNSCYQNSVLQGLSALPSLMTFLQDANLEARQDRDTTSVSLREIIATLSGSSRNGTHIWTPAKLKSMSSWQQQDAQEYFSKIMDELDKESIKAAKSAAAIDGLEVLGHDQDSMERGTVDDDVSKEAGSLQNKTWSTTVPARTLPKANPMEGLLAQRVACVECGFSEGLSLSPFSCLTVPLGKSPYYRIEECLNEYASLEEISGVECASCTLQRTEGQLARMVEAPTDGDVALPTKLMSLPPELRTLALQRLQHVRDALADEDFSDNTLTKTCQIPKKGRVSSTKTRQAVVARSPKALVIHINRSLFDEYTGSQSKNYAEVAFPRRLDLGPWNLGQDMSNNEREQRWNMDASTSMIASFPAGQKACGPFYTLKAVITHYGRHENGHYICYRQHGPRASLAENDVDEQDKQWWRLSDEDVSPVSEEQVLAQKGAFMLFYERLDAPRGQQTPTIQHPVMCDDEGNTIDTSAIDVADYEALDLQTPEEESTRPTLTADDLAKANIPEQESLDIPDSHPNASALPGVDDEPVTKGGEQESTQPALQKVQSPTMMRTSHTGSRRGKGGFMKGPRTVAAS